MNKKIEISAFDLAQRFIGIKEIGGAKNCEMIMAMLRLDNDWPENDETPWCSAFVNYICWLLRLPRSKSLLARSWLNIGYEPEDGWTVGFDVVILKRGIAQQPGPENLTAPGHVGFFAGFQREKIVNILGGNQGDQVGIKGYDIKSILGVRRLV